MNSPDRTRRFPAFSAALFTVSGFCAAAYQVVWHRLLTLSTGGTTSAAALSVAGFICGLGVGGLLGGMLSRRFTRSGCWLAFLACEALVLAAACYAPTWLAVQLPALSAADADGVATRALQLLSIVLPAVPMGATLPLLVRAEVTPTTRLERIIAWLYASNTLGAAWGAGLASWLGIPLFGLAGTNFFAASGTAAIVVACLARSLLFPRSLVDPIVAEAPSAARKGARSQSRRRIADEAKGYFDRRIVLSLAFAAGVISVGLEIVWFRVLDVAVKSTSFTYGTIVATYLGGLAGGTFLAARRDADAASNPLRTFIHLQILGLATAAANLILLVRLPTALPGYSGLIAYWRSYEGNQIGPTHGAADLLGLYFSLASALLIPTTLLFGAAFVHLQRAVQREAVLGGWRVAQTSAASIAGNVAGSLAVAFVLFPHFGTAGALRALLAVGLLLPAFRVVRIDRARAAWWQIAVLAVLIGSVPDNDSWWRRLHGEPIGEWLVDEDADAVCAVLPPEPESWEGFDLRLSVNGKGISWFPYGDTHSHLGWVPMLVHPHPKRSAIVGLGSGDTAWSAARRPEAAEIVVYEICGGMPRLLRDLDARRELPQLRELLTDPRVRFVHADGRHALLREAGRFDVIEIDALRPQSAGAGNLYSVEFYRICADRLAPGGILCQWSPTVRTIRTFCAAFPHVIFIPHGQIVLGGREPLMLDPAQLKASAATWNISSEHRDILLALLRDARSIRSADLPPGTINEDLFPRDEFAVPE